MYAPVIQSARTRKQYELGPYEAVLLDQISADGSIGYEFILVVFNKGATDPFLFVTSERNDPSAGAKILQELGFEEEDFPPIKEGKSHFLCLFDEEGHRIISNSNDWGDADKFEIAALQVLTERLGELR